MSHSHGHTTAAWTAVLIMLVGFTIAGVALPLAQEWLFFVGLGVVALGGVAGKVLQMMGLGQTVAYKDERDPDYGDEAGDEDGDRAVDKDGDRAVDTDEDAGTRQSRDAAAARTTPADAETTRG